MALSNKQKVEWLLSHLPRIDTLPLIELKELNEGDSDFENAQMITEGELHEEGVTDGEFNSDEDEVEQIEFKIANPLYVVQDNSKSKLLFSSLDEDEATEIFISFAEQNLSKKDLKEFQRL